MYYFRMKRIRISVKNESKDLKYLSFMYFTIMLIPINLKF